MPNRRRQKGDRVERKVVDMHGLLGIDTDRVPLSGAAGGRYSGDVAIDMPGVGFLHGEVKARATGGGFKTLEKWLGANELLFLVRDRQEPLVVMPWDTYEKFCEALTNVHGTTIDAADEEAE